MGNTITTKTQSLFPSETSLLSFQKCLCRENRLVNMHTAGLARPSPTIRGSSPAIHTTICFAGNGLLPSFANMKIMSFWCLRHWLVSPLALTHEAVPRQPLSPSLGSPVPFPNRPSASPTKGLNGHRRAGAGGWLNLGKHPEAFFCKLVKYTLFLCFHSVISAMSLEMGNRLLPSEPCQRWLLICIDFPLTLSPPETCRKTETD